jgi:hypothetical protein
MNVMHRDKHYHSIHPRDRDQCVTGSRNRYFRRKVMTAADFAAEQDYMIERRRLLNRALYGWGVVYGLGLEVDKNGLGKGELFLDCGLALDRHGREIIVASRHRVRGCEIFFCKDGKCEPGQKPKLKPRSWYLLSAHYAERWIDGVRVSDACDCGEQEWNRVCETVMFSLQPLAGEWCPPPPDTGCPPDCGCPLAGKEEEQHKQIPTAADTPHDGGEERQTPAPPPPPEPPRQPVHPRGDFTLCCWADKADVKCEDGHLCEWQDGLWLDPSSPVALACVKVLGVDECGEPIFDEIKECTPRRFVKRNDVLFDLIRGCDLTTIKELSWWEWTQRPRKEEARDYVEWHEFADYFPIDDSAPDARCKTGFKITFTGPVQASTLRAQVITIRGVFADEGTFWNSEFRMPVVGFDCTPDHYGHVREASVVVDRDWAKDEIALKSRRFKFDPDKPEFLPFLEIEIHGELILDCRGQPIDANSVGPLILPTGNGTPGGVCRTVFRVHPRPPIQRQSRSDAS